MLSEALWRAGALMPNFDEQCVVGVKTISKSGRPVRVDLKVDLHPSLHQHTLDALLSLQTSVLQVRHLNKLQYVS